MQYIALLRGINVGGKNKIPMSELKAAFEEEGFENVTSYINSGNILFTTDSADTIALIRRCRALILRTFGLEIAVCVIAAADLLEALAHAPDWWNASKDAKHNAIFVIPPASAEEVMRAVGDAKPEYEQVAAHGSVIFWSAPLKTFSKTRWSKVVGTKAYQDITIRNANTTLKLAALVRERSL